MRKIIAIVITLLTAISCTGFLACNFKDKSDTSSGENGNYEIQYYFENDQGDYVLDETKTVTGQKAVGATISKLDPETFDGYLINREHKDFRDLDIIRKDVTVYLKLYYKKDVQSSEPATNGNYEIHYYFENDQGEFVHDASKNVGGEKAVGETISVTVPGTFTGYVLFPEHQDYCNSAVITADVTVYLRLYYKKVVETPDPEQPENPEPPVTDPDLSVPSSSVAENPKTGAYVYNSDYLKTENEVELTLKVSDNSVTQGVIDLYNNANTLNYLGAKDSCYLFATKGDKASLNILVGDEFVEVKSATITPLANGERHVYNIKINADKSIVCSLNGNAVLTVSESDFTAKGLEPLTVAGRMGTYNETGAFNYRSLSAKNGAMNIQEIKEHLYNVTAKVSANYYVFNNKTLVIENKKEEVPFAGIYGYYDKAIEYQNAIYDASDLYGVLQVIAQKQGEYKLGALKQNVLASMGSFIQLYNDCLLMPMISATQVEVKNWDTGVSTGVFMSSDVYSRDTRWWVPNAYMLYSTWPAPNDKGVMDMLETEVASATDIKTLYDMSDKYILDIVRALSYKGLEFYYWHEYSKDPSSVLSQWWFLYTYIGANGAGFDYCGNVFDEFTWDKDFRLSGVFFNKNDNAFKTDPNEIMNNYTWMIAHQTLTAVDYSVTLNANGGTLSSYTLTGNSDSDLALPTPTKTGANFIGWYTSPAYEGNAITSILANTNRKDLTLYAKWSDNDSLAIKPANIFGSNMVVQQGKPFNVFGTGNNGTAVTVVLDGVTKTTTVANGSWNFLLCG